MSVNFENYASIPDWLKLQAPVILLMVAAWYFTRIKYKQDRSTSLTYKEKQKLIAEWEPAPLVEETVKEKKQILVKRNSGKFLEIDDEQYLNFASHNFLGMVGNRSVEEVAIESIKKYGVGSCGPRGFYGTFDVHLQLEEMLADFMDCEEAIVYSYGFSTVASAIPAYCKRGDIIFVDEMVNLAVQKGLDASRSKVLFFKHNDMEDLEKLMEEQDAKDSNKSKPTRKFVIVEGIYMNSGKICPLPRIVELSKKYKVRVFIDESVSFGTLGTNGKGVTEYYNIPRDEVDLIMCSLEWAVGITGGFCVGKSFVVDHQRLSGLGYCFSASLPPLLAMAAMKVLGLMQDPMLYLKLQRNCKLAHVKFSKIDGLVLEGDEISPIKHLYLRDSPKCCQEYETELLEKIVEYCRNKKVAFTVSAYLSDIEHLKLKPSIRLSLNSVFVEDDIQLGAEALSEACNVLLNAEGASQCKNLHDSAPL